MSPLCAQIFGRQAVQVASGKQRKTETLKYKQKAETEAKYYERSLFRKFETSFIVEGNTRF